MGYAEDIIVIMVNTDDESRPNTPKCMLSRAQGESEAIADYFHHKARLCRELELPFNEVKKQIVAGFRSRELCHYLLA